MIKIIIKYKIDKNYEEKVIYNEKGKYYDKIKIKMCAYYCA